MADWGKVESCPICDSALTHSCQRSYTTGKRGVIRCPFCGDYEIDDQALQSVWQFKPRDNGKEVIYAHAIRRMGYGKSSDEFPVITRELLDDWWNNGKLPSPFEQADNLILYLGEHQADPGKWVDISNRRTQVIIGAASSEGLLFVFSSLKADGFVDGDITFADMVRASAGQPIDPTAKSGSLGLTFKGWGRYDKLKKGAASGTTAFMAMQFGDDTLEGVVDECFRPAVEATGFDLRKINDPQHQRAGLIDDRLRVEIKAARFMLCDLTHNNNGAYWEAGFAEGLGKPVIYTCKKSVFDERASAGAGTHFDTNHHLHILWECDDFESTTEALKACIRTTIPDARQED